MKNKQLISCRGLVCVILSLIIVCGAAVSFPAVTVDLAETGDGSIATLYFTNNHYWHDVCAYIYDSTVNGNGDLSAWPGEAMAYVGMNSDSQSIYSITIDTSLYDKVIFNGTDNGTRKQTVDISVSDAAAGGSGVYCYDDANNDDSNKYNVGYYAFNSGSGGGESPVLDLSNHILLDNNGQETDYTLEYEENVGWRVKNSSGSYLNGKNANSGNNRIRDFGTKANAIDLQAVYDATSDGFVFTGTQNDARGNPRTWYLAWFAEAKEAWLYDSSQSVSIEHIQNAVSVETHSVTVTKKSTSDNYNYADDADAGTVTYTYGSTSGTFAGASASVTNIENGTTVTLTASASEGYTFLGWFTDEGWVKVESSYTRTIQGNDINLVARYTTNPVTGTYQFTYDRRDIDVSGASTTWTKTVSRALYGPEMDGYTGNGGVSGMPTYLYTSRAKLLFGASPLLTASLAVQGNEQEQDNVSTYKHMITWPDMASGALSSGVSTDTTTHTVSVTAVTTPNTFTFKYVMPGESLTVGATSIAYGDIATFNSKYSSESGCHYISGVDVSGVTYWSADAAGTVLLTTNQTFGMVIRGGYTASDLENDVVTVYAQTGAVPNTDGKAWKPYFEEATLTRSIADEGVDILHADYMANYFNVNGDAVQDLLGSNNRIKYGLIVMKANGTVTKANMELALSKMIAADKTSAYIGDREHIAYRYEYGDAAHISNFNRTLYTVSGSYSSLQGKTLTAMAYITIDGDNYFYSEANTELAVSAASD